MRSATFRFILNHLVILHDLVIIDCFLHLEHSVLVDFHHVDYFDIVRCFIYHNIHFDDLCFLLHCQNIHDLYIERTRRAYPSRLFL